MNFITGANYWSGQSWTGWTALCALKTRTDTNRQTQTIRHKQTDTEWHRKAERARQATTDINKRHRPKDTNRQTDRHVQTNK